MEDFWGILKRERYYGRRFAYSNSLVQMIEEHIDYYNSKRLQRNLGVLTPMEKHQQFYLAAKKTDGNHRCQLLTLPRLKPWDSCIADYCLRKRKDLHSLRKR